MQFGQAKNDINKQSCFDLQLRIFTLIKPSNTPRKTPTELLGEVTAEFYADLIQPYNTVKQQIENFPTNEAVYHLQVEIKKIAIKHIENIEEKQKKIYQDELRTKNIFQASEFTFEWFEFQNWLRPFCAFQLAMVEEWKLNFIAQLSSVKIGGIVTNPTAGEFEDSVLKAKESLSTVYAGYVINNDRRRKAVEIYKDQGIQTLSIVEDIDRAALESVRRLPEYMKNTHHVSKFREAQYANLKRFEMTILEMMEHEVHEAFLPYPTYDISETVKEFLFQNNSDAGKFINAWDLAVFVLQPTVNDLDAQYRDRAAHIGPIQRQDLSSKLKNLHERYGQVLHNIREQIEIVPEYLKNTTGSLYSQIEQQAILLNSNYAKIALAINKKFQEFINEIEKIKTANTAVSDTAE